MEEAQRCWDIDNKTVSNLVQKVNLINHGDMNVDHNISSAEKAIHYLSLVFIIILSSIQLLIETHSMSSLPSNNISISHYSIVYDNPLLGLSAMSNPPSRPNGKHDVVQLNADEKIVTEVMSLWKEMSFDVDKKLVLILFPLLQIMWLGKLWNF